MTWRFLFWESVIKAVNETSLKESSVTHKNAPSIIFNIKRNWQQPKYSKVGNCFCNVWWIHWVEYYVAIIRYGWLEDYGAMQKDIYIIINYMSWREEWVGGLFRIFRIAKNALYNEHMSLYVLKLIESTPPRASPGITTGTGLLCVYVVSCNKCGNCTKCNICATLWDMLIMEAIACVRFGERMGYLYLPLNFPLNVKLLLKKIIVKATKKYIQRKINKLYINQL